VTAATAKQTRTRRGYLVTVTAAHGSRFTVWAEYSCLVLFKAYGLADELGWDIVAWEGSV